MDITDAQRKELPDWMRWWPCLDEHGNYPLSRDEWARLVCRHLQIPLPAKDTKRPHISFTEDFINESVKLLEITRDEVKDKAIADRADQLIAQLQAVVEKLRAGNVKRREGAAKARAAKVAGGGVLGTEARLRLLVTSPDGEATEVKGWDAAAALVPNSTPKGLAIRMSQAMSKTGEPLAIIGRAKYADKMWTVRKLA